MNTATIQTTETEIYVGDGVYIDLPTLPYIKQLTTILRSHTLSQEYYEKYYLPENKKGCFSSYSEYQKIKSKNRSDGSLYGSSYMWYERDSKGHMIEGGKSECRAYGYRCFENGFTTVNDMTAFERRYIIDRPYNRFSINNLKRSTNDKATSRGYGRWGRDYLIKNEVMKWCDMNNVSYKKSWKYHQIIDELLKVIDTQEPSKYADLDTTYVMKKKPTYEPTPEISTTVRVMDNALQNQIKSFTTPEYISSHFGLSIQDPNHSIVSHLVFHPKQQFIFTLNQLNGRQLKGICLMNGLQKFSSKSRKQLINLITSINN
mgnify:CR=1 FL=1